MGGRQESPTSLDTYRRALKNHIRPALGELRIGEATTPRIDTALTKIKTTAGASTAKTCRAIISGTMKLAVRYGATSVNPVREVDTIEAPTKNPPRALTGEEVNLLRKSLTADERAIEADLPNLTTFNPPHRPLPRRQHRPPRPRPHPPNPPPPSPPLTREKVANTLTWPKTRIELVETGRSKIDPQLVAELVKAYRTTRDDRPDLLAQVDQATRPAESDKLAWIHSHTHARPPPSTKPATTPAKSPTN